MEPDRHEQLSPHPAEIETPIERARLQQLSGQDLHLLERLLRLLLSLVRIIPQKHASLARLKWLANGSQGTCAFSELPGSLEVWQYRRKEEIHVFPSP